MAHGAADVSPVVPLEISVTDGELAGVTVTDGAGAAVPGAVADEQAAGADDGAQVWTPETALAYGTSYTVTATATNEDAEKTTATSTFTTVAPETLSTPGIGPLDGQTVGVGMPIRVYFDEPVADKAAVESHLQVTSTTPTDGGWNWLSDSEVHFRPSTYWPENIEVTLDADLYASTSATACGGRRTGRCPSPSASGTCRSPTPPATPWRSTTATSWCRPSR
ncbi:Ig-like domain-containing protein [Blastococcus sp. SYSU DS0973]